MDRETMLVLGIISATLVLMVAMLLPPLLEQISLTVTKFRQTRKRQKVRQMVKQVKAELKEVQQATDQLQTRLAEMPAPPWPTEPQLKLVHPRTTSSQG